MFLENYIRLGQAPDKFHIFLEHRFIGVKPDKSGFFSIHSRVINNFYIFELIMFNYMTTYKCFEIQPFLEDKFFQAF